MVKEKHFIASMNIYLTECFKILKIIIKNGSDSDADHRSYF